MINALKCAHHSRHQLPYIDRMHCARVDTQHSEHNLSDLAHIHTHTQTLTNAHSRMSDFVKSAYQQSNSQAIESVTRFSLFVFFSSIPSNQNVLQLCVAGIAFGQH